MNLNNKFGQCCGCPGIINKPRELTVWTNSKIHDNDLMLQSGATNSNDYRALLQRNGSAILSNTANALNDNFKCKTNTNNLDNLFYLDSTNYNNIYDTLNMASLQVNKKNIDLSKSKERLSYSLAANNVMNLTTLTYSE